MLRRVSFLGLAVLIATSFAPADDPRGPITATAVQLDPREPARTRVGALRWLGGWVLASPNSHFGGISSMHGGAAGLLAVTDAGALIRFRLADGAVSDVDIAPLAEGPETLAPKYRRDAESMTIGPEGDFWIGFEGRNEIWRYDAKGKAKGHVAPAAMARWPGNGGPEAMLRLPDGRFLVFSEEGRARGAPSGATELLIFAGDPTGADTTPALAWLRRPAGYSITDAARLPDGRLLLLFRRFTMLDGVSAVLAVAETDSIRPGVLVVPREIARIAPPLSVDNMEALAVERDEAGRTILWIASDDNFNPLQRTLLLKFSLEI